MNFHVLLFFSCIYVGLVNAALLKTVSSQDLQHVVKINEYLLVAFVEADCKPCNDAELEIAQLASSMSDSLLDVTFVRVLGTQLPQQFGISDKPTILFYRHSVPLIYDGPVEAAALEEWISFSKQMALKILHDDNFEHLTQAASGATTGDWLVFFCDKNAESCQNLQPVFETAAMKLLAKRNVAFVDVSSSPGLTERFAVQKDLAILFFRLGKIYEYSIDKIDVTSLVAFAQGWYKNVNSVPVPVPPSPFDQLLTSVINHGHYAVIGAVVVIVFVVVFLVMLSCNSTKMTNETSRKRK